MKRNFHLIGEVNSHDIDRLIEHLLVYEEIDDVVFDESFRDLQIESDYEQLEDIIERGIKEQNLNLRSVERKAYDENVYETRYFTFSNFDSEENKVFLENYLNNDATVRKASFLSKQNVLKIETSDPFIFNKISYITEGLEEPIQVEEYFNATEKIFNQQFILKCLAMLFFILGAALAFVTRKDPDALTVIGYILMYSILVYYFGLQLYDRIVSKNYYCYALVVIVTTFLMLCFDFHLQAIIGLVAAIWIDLLYKEIRIRFVDKIVDEMNSMVSTVRVFNDPRYEDKKVEDVVKGDQVIYQEGQIVHFDGIVTEGQAVLDTTLMTGNPEVETVGMNQVVKSGSIIKEGSIEIKVENNYYGTSLYRLYQFSPKELYQHGYLEENSKKKDIFQSLVVSGIGILIMIAGVAFSSIGQHHFIMSGLVLIYLCYPLGLLKMRPLFYQSIKQIGLKNYVIFLNEDSLNRFIELSKRNELELKDDEFMKFHVGGFNEISIIDSYTILYGHQEDVEYMSKVARRVGELWRTNGYVLIGIKVALVVLFLLSVLPFTAVVLVNILVNMIIIYRSNRVLNMIL